MRPSAEEPAAGKGLIAGLVGLLAVGGAAVARLSDDVGQLAATGARTGSVFDEAGTVSKIGSAADGEHLQSLLSGAELTSDAVSLGLQALEASASTGEPEIAYGRPSPHPVAQYVLVTRAQSLEGTLARCVSQRTWCLVERVDSEEPVVISARFREHQRLWGREHPSDARWVAALGEALPAGVEAAWLEPEGSGWKIAYAGR